MHNTGRNIKKSIGLILFISVLLLFSCTNHDNSKLVIYAYDSFASEWGPGPKVFEAFEKSTGIKLEVIVPGDAGQVLSRAINEKKAPVADILIGLDNNLVKTAIDHNVLRTYRPKLYQKIPSELILDEKWHLTPYDWSSFAIMWDSDKLAVPPSSLADLTKPEYAKKLIIMDPRTSTPGLGFLAWTASVFGTNLSNYWQSLKPSILTVAPGWDTGYGLFTSGEAPLVMSYTTSAAYHAAEGQQARYHALEFSDGHPVQIEGLGITASSKHVKAAEAFIDFMLSAEVQSIIPETNWMYPVMPDTKLPDSFNAAKKPKKLLKTDANMASNIEVILNVLGSN